MDLSNIGEIVQSAALVVLAINQIMALRSRQFLQRYIEHVERKAENR